MNPYEQLSRVHLLFPGQEPCAIGWTLLWASLGWLLIATLIRDSRHESIRRKQHPRLTKPARWSNCFCAFVIGPILFSICFVAGYRLELFRVDQRNAYPDYATIVTASKYDASWRAQRTTMSLDPLSREANDYRLQMRYDKDHERLTGYVFSRQLNEGDLPVRDAVVLPQDAIATAPRSPTVADYTPIPRQHRERTTADGYRRFFQRIELLTIPKKYWPRDLFRDGKNSPQE